MPRIKDKWLTIRVTEKEKEQIEADAKANGLDSASAYMLQLYRKNRKKA